MCDFFLHISMFQSVLYQSGRVYIKALRGMRYGRKPNTIHTEQVRITYWSSQIENREIIPIPLLRPLGSEKPLAVLGRV